MTDSMQILKSRDVGFIESSFKQMDIVTPRVSHISDRMAGVTGKSDEFEVENILTERKSSKGSVEYYVKWKGWYWPTWEPKENLISCDVALKEYEQRKKYNALSVEKAYQVYEEHIDRMELAYSVETTPQNDFVFKDVDLTYVEPKGFKQAMLDKFRDKWIIAMQEEMMSLKKLNVFIELDYIPADRKLLNGIWVFKAKRDENNVIIRWKARFVVQGFMQVEGLDYNETYSPTSRMKSNKCLLSIVAKDDLELVQMDFDTAFLNSVVKEDMYVRVPQGYDFMGKSESGRPVVCLKLHKALYGLKQAPREWNQEIDAFLRSMGYMASTLDECLYVKHVGTQVIYLSLFVDDLLIAYSKEIEQVWLQDKDILQKKYAMKDIGECKWIFNMAVTRDRQRRTLSRVNTGAR
jgi:hypothetical protein